MEYTGHREHDEIPWEIMDLLARGREYPDDKDWAGWAWEVLAQAGDVPGYWGGDEDRQYPHQVLTLRALGHLYDTFADIYSGGDGNLVPVPELAGTDRPRISVIELVRFCEQNGYEDAHYPESVHGLEQGVITALARGLQDRLRHLLGTATLMATLAYARDSHAEQDESPLSVDELVSNGAFNDQMERVLNTDLTGDKQRVYAWLDGVINLP